MGAALANQLIRQQATKVALDDQLLSEGFQFRLQFVHETRPEFVHIHLLHQVDGALIGTQYVANRSRIIELLLALLEGRQEQLELVQDGLRLGFDSDLQDGISEVW